jgi:CRP/FNR family transcriptional regulator
MNFESKFWHLIQFNLAKRLSKDEMFHLCTSMMMKHYKRSVKIGINQKKGSGDVYFLKNGTIKIVSLTSDGDELIKDIIKKGDIFGIMCLLGVKNDDDYAIAMEDSTICVIDSDYFKKMMDENQNLNNFIFKLAGNRIKKLERNLASLIYKDSKTRIIDFIIDYVKDYGVEEGKFFIVKNLLSNSEIGKLTSTSRQTVNKTLNELKRDSFIDYDNETITISKKIIMDRIIEQIEVQKNQ